MAATTVNESCSLVPLIRTPDHPPYAEMIREAIASLGEEGGSSETSISKFIRSNNVDLPPAHDNLLSYHLSKLTKLGEICQFGTDSYTIPAHQNPNPSARRKRGRPPKTLAAAEPVEQLPGPPSQSSGHRTEDGDPDLGEKSSEPMRKRRGRPRKQPPGNRTDDRAPGAGEGSNGPVRKKLGRPPKAKGGKSKKTAKGPSSAAEGGDRVVPKRRGRPPKAKMTEEVPKKAE